MSFAPSPPQQLNGRRPSPREEESVSSYVVPDDATEPAAGQMRKSDFLALLRESVCAATSDAPAGTMWMAEACPTIEQWFDYYQTQSADHIEAAIRRYAPEAVNAGSAAGYLPPVTARVRSAVRRWAADGTVPEGLPAGPTSADMSGPAPPALNMLAGPGGGDAAVSAARVQAQLGPGTTLDGGVRGRMESAFQTDFSGVRVHADGRGAAVSDRLDARAFAVGNHVAFGAGAYDPGTLMGDALLAHELAHVVQQRGAGSGHATAQALEEQADMAAGQAVVGGLGAMAQLRAGVRIQRCDCKGEKSAHDKLVEAQQKYGDKLNDLARFIGSPTTSADEVIQIIDDLGDDAETVLLATPPFTKTSPAANLDLLAGSEGGRKIMARVVKAFSEGGNEAQKEAKNIEAALNLHLAKPVVKPDDEVAILILNSTLDKDPHKSEYNTVVPALKFPVQSYRKGFEEDGQVYYDPKLPPPEAGDTTLVSWTHEMAGQYPVIFVRLGPLASSHTDNYLYLTLYHEFQHYKRYLEMRKPESQKSPEGTALEEETRKTAPGDLHPNAEVEAISISLSADIAHLNDEELSSVLRYLAEVLEQSGPKLFRDPGIERIRKAVPRYPKGAQHVINLIKKGKDSHNKPLVPRLDPLVKALEADVKSAASHRK